LRARFVPPAAALVALAGTAFAGPSTQPFPAQFGLSTLLPANGGFGSNGVVLNGIDIQDECGRSVSAAGDVNADGYDDVIIGAQGGDPLSRGGAGESYVVFGAPGVGAGGEIILSTLSGANGFLIAGAVTQDRSGRSVSAAGDVNGDGVHDLIIGATGADPNGQSGAGTSYVIFGASGLGASGVLDLASINGVNGFALNGIDAGDMSGQSVSAAGDVNGDGIDDLIIGADAGDPNGQPQAGESYVVFGRDTAFDGNFPAAFNLSSLNGTNGFVLNGVSAGERSGQSVSCAGDVNGDGFSDLIIGAYGATGNAGRSYVVFGGPAVGVGGVLNLSSLNGINGFVLNGIDGNDRSGWSVSSAGDVNGDGLDDLIIGAAQADPNGQPDAGEAYVVFGAPGLGAGGVFNLASLNGVNGFVLNGIDFTGLAGRSVAAAGDVNGDGVDDLIVGAPAGGSSYAGESYVVFGRPGLGAGGAFNLSTLNGTSGFAVTGINLGDQSGSSVARAGDVNADGVDDLIIGAAAADPDGQSDAGQSYLVFGRANGKRWESPTGGAWDSGLNWTGGTAPTAGFPVIDTLFGVTVTGPAGAVFLNGLVLGAATGRTTLNLQPNSLISIERDFSIPASAAVGGHGTLAVEGEMSNQGLIQPQDLVLVAAGGLINSGDIRIESFVPSPEPKRVTVFGAVVIAPGGEVVVRGAAVVEATDGLTNEGSASFAFASATVYGAMSNTTGIVSISGASEIILADDAANDSAIELTTDSSLSILGSLSGSGVSGPGGGASGPVYIEGGLIPGFALQAGTASFGGDIFLGAGAVTTIEVGGTTPGADLDQIATLANLGVAGLLRVELIPGFTPSPGDVYQVFDFATTTGSFSQVVLDPSLIAANADTSQLLITGQIVIPAAVCCPGNANGDGVVDFDDIVAILANWLEGSIPSSPNNNGDANCDGGVDFDDIVAALGAWLNACP